jgi:hypothetical protein
MNTYLPQSIKEMPLLVHYSKSSALTTDHLILQSKHNILLQAVPSCIIARFTCLTTGARTI